MIMANIVTDDFDGSALPEYFLDNLFDGVIATLRADSRFGPVARKLSRVELELIFADLKAQVRHRNLHPGWSQCDDQLGLFGQRRVSS
jgi:hypothetical protein